MQLAQAKTLGVLNNHTGGIRDINTYLQYRGRNQNIDLAGFKFRHNLILLFLFKPAMDKPKRKILKFACL